MFREFDCCFGRRSQRECRDWREYTGGPAFMYIILWVHTLPLSAVNALRRKKASASVPWSWLSPLLWQPCSSNSIPYLMCLLLSSWRLWCTRWYIVMICWSLSESSAIREKQNRRSAKGCFKTCADGAAIKMQWRYPRHCISFALIYDLLHYNTSSLFFNAEAMTASIS